MIGKFVSEEDGDTTVAFGIIKDQFVITMNGSGFEAVHLPKKELDILIRFLMYLQDELAEVENKKETE